MRLLLSIPAVLLLAACNVSKEGNSVTVQYDENTAENVVEDIGDTAKNVGGAIANDVEETADKVQNTDIDLDVDTNAGGNAQ